MCSDNNSLRSVLNVTPICALLHLGTNISIKSKGDEIGSRVDLMTTGAFHMCCSTVHFAQIVNLATQGKWSLPDGARLYPNGAQWTQHNQKCSQNDLQMTSPWSCYRSCKITPESTRVGGMRRQPGKLLWDSILGLLLLRAMPAHVDKSPSPTIKTLAGLRSLWRIRPEQIVL